MWTKKKSASQNSTKSGVKSKKKSSSQKIGECPRIVVFISKNARIFTKSEVNTKKKVFIPKYTRFFMNSGVKPQKKSVFIAKSTKKQFLLTNSGVITSILGVSGLELHSSNTKPVNFFGAQLSLGGGTILTWGGHNSRLGGTAP